MFKSSSLNVFGNVLYYYFLSFWLNHCLFFNPKNLNPQIGNSSVYRIQLNRCFPFLPEDEGRPIFRNVAIFNVLRFLRLKTKQVSVWRQENKNSATAAHACRKRRLKWVPSAWGYNWAILSPGDINTEAWSSRLGVERRVNNPAS
jgi:hypothetical protein